MKGAQLVFRAHRACGVAVLGVGLAYAIRTGSGSTRLVDHLRHAKAHNYTCPGVVTVIPSRAPSSAAGGGAPALLTAAALLAAPRAPAAASQAGNSAASRLLSIAAGRSATWPGPPGVFAARLRPWRSGVRGHSAPGCKEAE